MFGLGPAELIVILVIALLVLGPSRIPEAASSLGKAIRSFRRATRELRDQIDIDDEVRRPFEDLRSALRDEPPPPVPSDRLMGPIPMPAPGIEPAGASADPTPAAPADASEGKSPPKATADPTAGVAESKAHMSAAPKGQEPVR
jgi:sec-independent protein translocase protein TatB